MITPEIFLTEVQDLLDFLGVHGRCASESGNCLYAPPHGSESLAGHPGCAVGRRLTPEERVLWGPIYDSYQDALENKYLESPHLKVPEYFKDWPPYVVQLLQRVHDKEPRSYQEHIIIEALIELGMTNPDERQTAINNLNWPPPKESS